MGVAPSLKRDTLNILVSKFVVVTFSGKKKNEANTRQIVFDSLPECAV